MSPAMKRVRAFVRRAASADVPVLLVGETGTGKSLVARCLHGESPRRDGPFVAVNCASVPDGLFESEFFGHRRGAFTGAGESREGLFEQAGGGTLFLDEVGELPLRQQAKLLAVLEDGEVRRVGGTRARRVDVRVVAATCRNLGRALQEGEFRPDLYHRLALLRCEIPPLRSRPDDVDLLADRILADVARRHDRSAAELGPGARGLLRACPWPGNVRQLAHVLEAAVILSGGPSLGSGDLERILEADPTLRGAAPAGGGDRSRPEPGSGRYSFFGSGEDEREMIRRALEAHRGNRTRAARALGMSRTTLRARIRRYGLG